MVVGEGEGSFQIGDGIVQIRQIVRAYLWGVGSGAVYGDEGGNDERESDEGKEGKVECVLGE